MNLKRVIYQKIYEIMTEGKCTFKISMILFCTVFLFCKESPPPEPAELEAWFVSCLNEPSPQLLHSTSGSCDSLVRVIRKKSITGKGSAVLTDSTGYKYTLGFQTPPVISQDTTYPCIIYLHGGIGTTLSNKGEHAYEMVAMLADSMDLFMVSPSANREVPWWSAGGLSRIIQTLRYMTMHYPVNPKKVFLMGVSDGATGCWAAANTIAEPFAGFIAVSGFGGMLPRLGMKLIPQNLMQRPIYNVNAGNDRLYPIAAVNQFLDQMESRGVGIKRMVYPEEQHGFDYRIREMDTLCSLIRTWTHPATGAVNWYGNQQYPFMVKNVFSVKYDSNQRNYFIQEYCTSDTFFIYSSGLISIQMYFDTDNHCSRNGIFKINDKRVCKLRARRFNRKDELRILKLRGFPLTLDWNTFIIPL